MVAELNIIRTHSLTHYPLTCRVLSLSNDNISSPVSPFPPLGHFQTKRPSLSLLLYRSEIRGLLTNFLPSFVSRACESLFSFLSYQHAVVELFRFSLLLTLFSSFFSFSHWENEPQSSSSSAFPAVHYFAKTLKARLSIELHSLASSCSLIDHVDDAVGEQSEVSGPPLVQVLLDGHLLLLLFIILISTLIVAL